MAATIRLYDPIPTASSPDPSHYTGRWVLTVDPFTLPVGMSGNVTEYRIVIASLAEPGSYVTFGLGNDSETPADLTAGFVYDSDSPLSWVTYVNADRWGPGGFETDPMPDWLSDWVDTVEISDADWNVFEVPGGFTIDAASDPSWLFSDPVDPGVTSQWKVVAVDVGTGASPVELTNAVIHPIDIQLNEAETTQIDMATVDPQATELFDPTREIQIWRDDDVLFWGPVVRLEANRDTITAQCAGPWWYLTRRYFGEADRANLFTNGGFEDGMTGWTAVGLTPVVDPFRALEGRKSIRLTGDASDHTDHISQTWTHTAGGHPLGDLVTVAAWVWVASEDYAGTALDNAGMIVTHKDGGTTIFDALVEVWDDTPKDQWVRLTEVEVPNVFPGQTVTVDLYPPFGTAWYDLVTGTFMESLAFDEQDMATVISGVVLYAQDLYLDFSHGKSDLGIDVDIDPTGITMSKSWQFADHQNIADELRLFTETRDGVDYSIDLTATTRTFRAWYPQKGTVRGTTLTYDDQIQAFTWAHDRNQVANNVVVLGPGDGPDREEGGASTTTAGPDLEDVIIAPDATLPGELDRMATERHAVVSNPEILEVICTDLFDGAAVGDWFPVVIDLDSIQVNDVYRVVRMVADPAMDTLALTMNRQDPVTPEAAMARFPRAVDACLAPGGGVWVVGSDGGVGNYGGAAFFGSMGGTPLNAPMVAIVPHGADGYWLVGADTGIFAYGDAPVRWGYGPMIASEYAAGDRAIVAAEAVDPGGVDTLILIADDGSTYTAAS